MELKDISRRIVGQHWRLIALCMVIAASVAALVVPHAQSYTASTRLVLDVPDPQTTAETTGISDTVTAIATSPSEVAAALRDAGIKHRDPVTVANSVAVASLGQSAVVDLSISDGNPHVAAALANALGAEVIRTRLAVTRGSASRTMAQLDQEISSVNQRIVSEETVINQLTVSLAAAPTPAQANTIRAKQSAAVRQSDLLSQTRASLESQRVSLLSTNALARTPSIISPAVVPPASNATGAKTDVVLGLFLGLIIGIGIASVIEAVRPKVIGGDAVASELHAPLLGTLATEPGDASPAELESLALCVRLAGKKARIPNIRLIPVHEETDLRTFAQLLDETWTISGADGEEDLAPSRAFEATAAARGRGSSAAYSLDEEAPYRIRPFDPGSVLANGARVGIVVVSPDRVARSELEATMHLLRVTPGSVLGVVTYRQSRQPGQLGRLENDGK